MEKCVTLYIPKGHIVKVTSKPFKTKNEPFASIFWLSISDVV